MRVLAELGLGAPGAKFLGCITRSQGGGMSLKSSGTFVMI